jgi:hypothetical protein
MVSHTWLAMSRKWAGANYDGWDIKQGAALPNLPFDHDYDSARSAYGGFRLPH